MKTVYTKDVESIRQLRRRPRTKREVLTLGGQGDYVVDPKELQIFIRLLLASKNHGDMRKLVYSLFTNREISDIVRRIMIARLLTKGKTYDEIEKEARAGRPTISLVSKVLRFNPDLVNMLNPEMKWKGPDETMIINRLKRGK